MSDNNKEFEYLEHTADVKFKAYGNSIEKQFANAAAAMIGVLTEDLVQSKINKSISVDGNDLKALLYNFLEEILFLLDSEQFLYASASGLNINRMSGKYILSALLSGDKAANYELHGDIKAVTYAEMEITDNFVQVVLDI